MVMEPFIAHMASTLRHLKNGQLSQKACTGITNQIQFQHSQGDVNGIRLQCNVEGSIDLTGEGILTEHRNDYWVTGTEKRSEETNFG